MSVLSELIGLLEPIVPTYTSVYTGENTPKYAVLTPLVDSLEYFTDNKPNFLSEEVRVSLFVKGNYLQTKNRVIKALLREELDITDMRYVECEQDTGYHHYAIDVKKHENIKEI